jgi:hypothetical protein
MPMGGRVRRGSRGRRGGNGPVPTGHWWSTDLIDRGSPQMDLAAGVAEAGRKVDGGGGVDYRQYALPSAPGLSASSTGAATSVSAPPLLPRALPVWCKPGWLTLRHL